MVAEPSRDAAIAANSLWKLARLGTVLARANAAGVPIIVLKGAAVLGHVFELHERPMNDVDLLIRPADRERLLECLAPEVRLAGESPALDLLPHDLSGEFGALFEGLPLDVHTNLMNRPWLRRVVALDERVSGSGRSRSRSRASRHWGSRPRIRSSTSPGTPCCTTRVGNAGPPKTCGG
ncbi:MAG TPA: hypothetical protein DCK98_03165 [Chloroflexi bacterium]|nr:hypothetical protein [Chloroflexota bacterium]HAL28057.1 hypothetical protein [Chloroflexota bacterium]